MEINDWRRLKLDHPLDENIFRVLSEELKFTKLTKVQNAVIPLFLKNKDVIVKVDLHLKRRVLGLARLCLT